MLASLERDAKARPGGTTRPRRFGKVQGLALLTVALLAGAGAYFFYAPADDATVRSAAAPSTPAVVTPVVVTPTGVAAAASGVAAPEAMAASAPASAVAQIELVTAAAPSSSPLASAAAVPSTDASAGNPPTALAGGAVDPPLAPKPAASVPGSRGKKAQAKESGAKPAAPVVASTRSGSARADAAPVRPARKDDEDADTALVAAMIARLDRRGATPGAAATSTVRKDDGPALVEALRQCESKTDPLDARRCRNRACETHWGKADACPAARAPKGSLGTSGERGKPG